MPRMDSFKSWTKNSRMVEAQYRNFEFAFRIPLASSLKKKPHTRKSLFHSKRNPTQNKSSKERFSGVGGPRLCEALADFVELPQYRSVRLHFKLQIARRVRLDLMTNFC